MGTFCVMCTIKITFAKGNLFVGGYMPACGLNKTYKEEETPKQKSPLVVKWVLKKFSFQVQAKHFDWGFSKFISYEEMKRLIWKINWIKETCAQCLISFSLQGGMTLTYDPSTALANGSVKSSVHGWDEGREDFVPCWLKSATICPGSTPLPTAWLPTGWSGPPRFLLTCIRLFPPTRYTQVLVGICSHSKSQHKYWQMWHNSHICLLARCITLLGFTTSRTSCRPRSVIPLPLAQFRSFFFKM